MSAHTPEQVWLVFGPDMMNGDIDILPVEDYEPEPAENCTVARYVIADRAETAERLLRQVSELWALHGIAPEMRKTIDAALAKAEGK